MHCFLFPKQRSKCKTTFHLTMRAAATDSEDLRYMENCTLILQLRFTTSYAWNSCKRETDSIQSQHRLGWNPLSLVRQDCAQDTKKHGENGAHRLFRLGQGAGPVWPNSAPGWPKPGNQKTHVFIMANRYSLPNL